MLHRLGEVVERAWPDFPGDRVALLSGDCVEIWTLSSPRRLMTLDAPIRDFAFVPGTNFAAAVHMTAYAPTRRAKATYQTVLWDLKAGTSKLLGAAVPTFEDTLRGIRVTRSRVLAIVGEAVHVYEPRNNNEHTCGSMVHDARFADDGTIIALAYEHASGDWKLSVQRFDGTRRVSSRAVPDLPGALTSSIDEILPDKRGVWLLTGERAFLWEGRSLKTFAAADVHYRCVDGEVHAISSRIDGAKIELIDFDVRGRERNRVTATLPVLVHHVEALPSRDALRWLITSREPEPSAFVVLGT